MKRWLFRVGLFGLAVAPLFGVSDRLAVPAVAQQSFVQAGRSEPGGDRDEQDFRRGYRDGFRDGYEDGRSGEPGSRPHKDAPREISPYERGYERGYQAGVARGRRESEPRQ